MDIKIMILGMVAVTMLPRILPFYAFDVEKLSKPFKTFLGFIPFTVLGALVLPAGLNGITDEPIISIICLLVAIAISWVKGGVIWPLIGTVGVAMLLKVLEIF